MREGMCQPSQRLSTATENAMENWVGTKLFVFRSDYNVHLPILFEIYKRDL